MGTQKESKKIFIEYITPSIDGSQTTSAVKSTSPPLTCTQSVQTELSWAWSSDLQCVCFFKTRHSNVLLEGEKKIKIYKMKEMTTWLG